MLLLRRGSRWQRWCLDRMQNFQFSSKNKSWRAFNLFVFSSGGSLNTWALLSRWWDGIRWAHLRAIWQEIQSPDVWAWYHGIIFHRKWSCPVWRFGFSLAWSGNWSPECDVRSVGLLKESIWTTQNCWSRTWYHGKDWCSPTSFTVKEHCQLTGELTLWKCLPASISNPSLFCYRSQGRRWNVIITLCCGNACSDRRTDRSSSCLIDV